MDKPRGAGGGRVGQSGTDFVVEFKHSLMFCGTFYYIFNSILRISSITKITKNICLRLNRRRYFFLLIPIKVDKSGVGVSEGV